MSKDRKPEAEIIAKPKTSNQAHHRGPKRPDKPLYVPRAVRERLSSQNSQQPPGDKILTSPAPDSCLCRSSEPFMPETAETTKSSCTSTTATEKCPCGAAECVCSYQHGSPTCGAAEAGSETWAAPLLSLARMTLGSEEKDQELLPAVSCTDLTEEVNVLVVVLFDRNICIPTVNDLWCICPVRLCRT